VNEQRYILAIAYRAGRADQIIKGVDGRRDYFTEAELEKAAWSFMKSATRDMGLFHADGTVGHVTPVESYIWRGNDWDLGNGTIVKSGDWLLGGLCDEPAWQLVKSGRVDGLSPQGVAKRRKAAS
jgi:hypothetical protein